MNPEGHILCVEPYQHLLASRCQLLQSAGYDAINASPQFAVIILAAKKFDLIVISRATEFETNCIVNLSDDAGVLVVSEFTSTPELLDQVSDRLQHVRNKRV